MKNIEQKVLLVLVILIAGCTNAISFEDDDHQEPVVQETTPQAPKVVSGRVQNAGSPHEVPEAMQP